MRGHGPEPPRPPSAAAVDRLRVQGLRQLGYDRGRSGREPLKPDDLIYMASYWRGRASRPKP